MITSLLTSLFRITMFWYIVAMLVLFLGDPSWAEAIYAHIADYPWVPDMELHGLSTAAAVQWQLLAFWTVPMLCIWAASVGLGILVAEIQCQLGLYKQRAHLKPTGAFWSVSVASYSLGKLPVATTPALIGQSVTLGGPGNYKSADAAHVELRGTMKDVVKMLTPAERQLAEELLQLLLQSPDHFAGLGHGVGLLEHTLNVVTEAASKVTPEFRMPFLAALSHDIGKLVTFQPDGQGGWKKRGLHSRESARILATLPGFQELPDLHQRALLLAVKYDHAPSKMPELRGEREACTMAMRIISALAMADRKATADEKERNLERIQPEDLLWKDFIDFLREAPVVQRGKKGVANQVNNPPDSPYLYLYEAPWRDAAVRRLPGEVAAALDLTRRDAGKMAKYTRYLVERLRKEGLLLETFTGKDSEGNPQVMSVSDANPLWDIQSGTGEKAVVLRGILVLHADELWKRLNYRISIRSPFPVQILAPNADTDGRVNDSPRANREEPRTPEVSDGMLLTDIENKDTMASLGLADGTAGDMPKAGKPKTRGRSGFKPVEQSTAVSDAVVGLAPASPVKKQIVPAKPVKPPVDVLTPPVQGLAAEDEELTEQERQELAEMAAAMASVAQADNPQESEDTSSVATTNALAYLNLAPEPSLDVAAAPKIEDSQPAPAQPATRIDAVAGLAEGDSKPVRNKASGPKRVVDPSSPKKHQEGPKPHSAEAVKAVTPEGEASSDTDGLSRSERRMGLAIADAATVAAYPDLKVGDKYYTEQSPNVQSGLTTPGSKYKGDQQASTSTTSGPRKVRRRLTT